MFLSISERRIKAVVSFYSSKKSVTLQVSAAARPFSSVAGIVAAGSEDSEKVT
jgi:hypothetical protein